MFKRYQLLSYFKFALPAAVLYSIMAGIFIHNNSFETSFVLYIGNMLFGICIGLFLWFYNKRRKEDASAGMMVYSGHITAAMGIIIACVLCLVLLLVLAPGAFQSARHSTEVLEQAPAQMEGNNRSLLLILFMNAIIGNVCAGSFVSLIMPYTIKRSQSGEVAQMTRDEIKVMQQGER